MTEVLSDNTPNNDLRRWRATEALLLAAAAPYAYALALCYRYGQADYFKIPVSLVSVTLEDCLRATGALLGLTIALAAAANLLISLTPKRLRFGALGRRVTPPAIFMGILILTQNWNWYLWLWIVIPSLPLIVMVVGALFFRKRDQSFEEAFAKADAEDASWTYNNSVLPIFLRRVEPGTFLAVVYALVLLGVAAQLGNFASRDTDTFLWNPKTGEILLGNFNGIMVFGTTTHDRQLGKQFHIMRDEKLDLRLSLIKLGPLLPS